MPLPHLQVILATESVPDCLRHALQDVPATATYWPLSEALRSDPAQADAVVLVVPEDPLRLRGSVRALFDRLAESPRAILVMTSNGRPAPHLPHPATLPVTFARDIDVRDLAVRLGMLLEMRNSLDSLQRGLLANRRSRESAARRYAGQLRLASQIQRGFLPDALPRIGPVSFELVFRPVDYVSGDIYDVQRLDEDHVAIALADASGHGIPAALLTVYIKRALRGKRVENGAVRILPPDLVLEALNEDILDAHLSECPFVAATYAVLNVGTLELQLARGGAPYPLRRTADGAVHVLTAPGSVIGIVPDAHFSIATVQLERGDTLLFYSDGLERIVTPARGPMSPRRLADTAAQFAEQGRAALQAAVCAPALVGAAVPGHASTPAAAPRCAARERRSAHDDAPADDPVPHCIVANSPWCDTLRRLGAGPALEQACGRHRTLRRMGYPLDDLTVIAVQIDT